MAWYISLFKARLKIILDQYRRYGFFALIANHGAICVILFGGALTTEFLAKAVGVRPVLPVLLVTMVIAPMVMPMAFVLVSLILEWIVELLKPRSIKSKGAFKFRTQLEGWCGTVGKKS
jgi:hypothetical protein